MLYFAIISSVVLFIKFLFTQFNQCLNQNVNQNQCCFVKQFYCEWVLMLICESQNKLAMQLISTHFEITCFKSVTISFSWLAIMLIWLWTIILSLILDWQSFFWGLFRLFQRLLYSNYYLSVIIIIASSTFLIIPR